MRTNLFLLSLIIFIANTSCNDRPQQNPPDKKVEHKGPVTAGEAHLGEHMGQMQYYLVKLGLAIQNKNVPLAKFYAHEVDEVATDLVEMNIIDEKHEISNLVKTMLLPQVILLERGLDSNDITTSNGQYKNIITNCNACHTTTKHEFITIEEPSQPFNGQSFKLPAKK